MNSENFTEIKIAGHTYKQRGEFSKFKLILNQDNGNKMEMDIKPDSKEQEMINDALIIQNNPEDYFGLAINSKGNLAITSFYNKDDLKNIIIPEEINGMKVEYIADVFRKADVDRVFFPDTVVAIAVGCFEDNEYVKEVYLPQNLTTIPPQCFKKCKNLEKINLSHIKEFSIQSFSGCKSFKYLHLDNAQKIQPSAFEMCTKLKTVEAPRLFKLGSESFKACIDLETVKLSNEIDTIERKTFKDCISLKNITEIDGLKIIHEESFCNCKKLENFPFPNTLKKIKNSAFKNSGIKGELIIPESVDEIEADAFYNCSFSEVSVPEKTNFSPISFGLSNIDKIMIRYSEINKIKVLER